MPIFSTVSRRQIIVGATSIAGAMTIPRMALAITSDEAAKLITKLVADINIIINSGKSEPVMYRDFEKVFKKYGDTPTIARSSLGINWRSASSSQKKKYVKAFEGYIARKYGRRFREFIGGEITVTGSKKAKGGYLVSSTARLQGMAPFPLEWQVSDKSGKDLMFNLYIEGISLLATERTEIGAMLDRRGGNIDKLISHLNKSG